MGAGLIISSETPSIVEGNRYTWMKVLEDGSIEFYEPTDGGWTKIRTLPAPSDHKHSDVKLELKTDAGMLVFENGILIKVGK